MPRRELAVPDAMAVAPAMARLVEWARRKEIVHGASADDHELTDPELSNGPDYVDTYPPGLVPRMIEGRCALLLLKKSFDVLSNPNAAAVVTTLDPSEVALFGVATDVCDHAAIVGLLQRGRTVTFLEDAARGLSDGHTAACFAQVRQASVRFATSTEIVTHSP